MECKLTNWDMVLHRIKPLPQNKRKEARNIYYEDSLCDFFDFCIKCHCITQQGANIINTYITRYSSFDENYSENDSDMLNQVLDLLKLDEN